MAMHDPVRQLLALGDDPAMVFRGLGLSYADLHALVQAQDAFLTEHGLTPGSVVALRGDFSPLTIALLLALVAINLVGDRLREVLNPRTQR